MPDAAPCADQSLNFMMSQILRLYFSRTYHLLGRLDVHPGQVPLLFELYSQGGKSQKELVDKLLVRPPTVAVMIKRLEKSGLVKRQHDAKDQRITRIYLSEKGAQIVCEIQQTLKEMEYECFRDFSPEEVEQCKILFTHIKANLAAACKEEDTDGCPLTERGIPHAETT